MEPQVLSRLILVEFWFCVLGIQYNFAENDLVWRDQQDQREGAVDTKFQNQVCHIYLASSKMRSHILV
jgi:hypothetical protein